MPITNPQSGTNIHEIADGIYRINTPVRFEGGPEGFSFNQYLIIDDEPLLFYTGLRKILPLVRETEASVIAPERLRYITFSHVEADECGSLTEWLATAPQAMPLCGSIAAMVSVADLAERPARTLAGEQAITLGKHTVRWLDTPHLPHAREYNFLVEEQARTLLCGDLFTQGRAELPALTESDILGPNEAFRHDMDYFSHSSKAGGMLDKLVALQPSTLACMHGSAWRGDGAALLHELAAAMIQ